MFHFYGTHSLLFITFASPDPGPYYYYYHQNNPSPIAFASIEDRMVGFEVSFNYFQLKSTIIVVLSVKFDGTYSPAILPTLPSP